MSAEDGSGFTRFLHGIDRKTLVGVAVFLLAIFVAIPLLIAASGRTDFYYTLTSVALLSSPRRRLADVLTDGTMAGPPSLDRPYVAAILVTQGRHSSGCRSHRGVFAAASRADGLPILRSGRLLRMIRWC